ncbi:MAG: ferric reductase-like transmembrane domain-containing protein [Pseudomonadota bacterium]
MPRLRALAAWTALALAAGVPLAIAAASPQLAWREPIYIAAGFAGALALALLLIQPLLLAGSVLPGLAPRRARLWHRLGGAALVAAVLVHVIGLWITSPLDVIDALTFTSPTPFSAWGVVALWAVLAAALLAVLRRRLGPRAWRLGHSALVAVAVPTTVVHALLIEGTMGTWSKAALCALALAAAAKTLAEKRAWTLLRRRKA